MAKEDKEEKEEGLVIVTDDPKNLDVPAISEKDEDLPDPKEAKDKGDKKEDQEDKDEDEPEAEDERLGASEETEAEAEQKKQERASHKTRNQKRKAAEARLRTEVRFLETRNDKLERQIQEIVSRQDSTDKSALDTKISQHKALIRKAESVMAEAVTNSKGDELAEAQRIRDQLRDQLKDFEAAKEDSERAPEQEKPPPPNPKVVANARAWAKRNDWYDFNLKDRDSKIARVIDLEMIDEGFDPATKEYWDELDSRIAEVLPKRVKGKKAKNGRDTEDEDIDDDEDEDERPKSKKRKEREGVRAGNGGPKFRTGGPGRDLRANEVYLSRERIEALKEAGAWDDLELREKYLKRYRDYDREHGIS
jgi:hypothetical protein